MKVPGVTGWLDTNYKGKADATIEALEKVDFVYLHVESPDEAGHSGNYEHKLKAIEDFDKLVVGNLMDGMKRVAEYRILLLPDHPTPLDMRNHTDEPVPFALFDSRVKRENKDVAYDESINERNDILVFEVGHKLMHYLIKEL